MVLPPKPVHPKGERNELSKQVATATLEVDTFFRFNKKDCGAVNFR